MFIGKLIIKNNYLVLCTVDGQELTLASKGKLIEIPIHEESGWVKFVSDGIIRAFSGARIGNVLNILRRTE